MHRLRTVLPLALLAAIGLAPSAHATFAGENGRIFYVENAYSQFSTVASVCSETGGHYKQVAERAGFAMPSPDGSMVAYNKLTASGQNDGIYVARADGSDPQKMTDPRLGGIWPTWSPDGKKLTFREYVYYDALGYSRLQPVVEDIATKVITPLLTDSTIESGSVVLQNAWAPDGTSIYFPASKVGGSGSDVYEVPAGGGTATRVLGTDDDLPFYDGLDFAPDGQSFFAARQTSNAAGHDTEWLRFPTAGGTPFTYGVSNGAGSGTGKEIFSFSPDGRKILYDSLPGQMMWTADADGQNPVALHISGSYPRWSTNTDDCTDPGAATIKINEVGLGSRPFVELLDAADETFPDAQGPYKLVTYDGAGTRTAAHTISSTLLQGRDNTKPLLISSAAADAAFGVHGEDALDIALPAAGSACFTKGAAETAVSCVTWGCVTKAVPKSTLIPAAIDGRSAQRQGLGSTVFHEAAPTPGAANVAGDKVASCREADQSQPVPSPTATPESTPVATNAPVGPTTTPAGPSVSPNTGVPAAPGAAKPAFPVSLPKSTKASALSTGWTVSVTSPAKGTATATLTVAGKTIATGSATAKAGKSVKVKLKVTKVARAKLKGLKGKTATLTIKAGGKTVTQTITLG